MAPRVRGGRRSGPHPGGARRSRGRMASSRKLTRQGARSARPSRPRAARARRAGAAHNWRGGRGVRVRFSVGLARYSVVILWAASSLGAGHLCPAVETCPQRESLLYAPPIPTENRAAERRLRIRSTASANARQARLFCLALTKGQPDERPPTVAPPFHSGSAEVHRRRFRFDRRGTCWRRVDRRPWQALRLLPLERPAVA